MKVRVSDYIADFLVQHGIHHVFTVVGGGAMFLNDSFGHHPQLHCLYNHHEQASAMAAEAYARVAGKPAAVCVTSGPGAINALNGVVGAYQDSIPMIVLSGQTKSTLTVKYSGLHLRTLGNQEFDIVSALGNMAKYAEMIMNPKRIRYCLEKAYYLATHGRQGPCWLDIPVDIQGTYVETDELQPWNLEEEKASASLTDVRQAARWVLEKFKQAKRPVLYAGNGIRLADGIPSLQRLVEYLQIPVVTCWDSIDLISTDNALYCGRGGIMGDRAGNFAVQNSDFLLCIGTRLNIYQVGYDVKTWARAAYTVVVDIDSEELKKKTIRADYPICADAGEFMDAVYQVAKAEGIAGSEEQRKWQAQCLQWKKTYPVVTEKQYKETGTANVYAFMDRLGRLAEEESITVVTNGSASVVGSQTYYIKSGDRFIMNCGVSSMGYGLPAAVGACVANHKKSVICVEGDGSIMMNLQELQTAVTNQLPIHLFIINNNGYHQIRQTQNNVFHDGLVGVGPESHDLGFPEFKKISEAFGISYYSISDNEMMAPLITRILRQSEMTLCEVFVSETQKFEPKSATKRLPDGTLISPPLEDLAPFLPREELERNMYIPLVEERKK